MVLGVWGLSDGFKERTTWVKKGSSSNADSSAEDGGLAEIQAQVYRFLGHDSNVRAFIFRLGDVFIPLVSSSYISHQIQKQVIL